MTKPLPLDWKTCCSFSQKFVEKLQWLFRMPWAPAELVQMSIDCCRHTAFIAQKIELHRLPYALDILRVDAELCNEFSLMYNNFMLEEPVQSAIPRPPIRPDWTLLKHVLLEEIDESFSSTIGHPKKPNFASLVSWKTIKIWNTFLDIIILIPFQ